MALYYPNKRLESPGINILALDTCESSAQLAGSSSTQMMIYLMKTSVNAVGLLLAAALNPSNDITKLSCLGLRKTFPGNMMDFLSPTISHHPVYCCVAPAQFSCGHRRFLYSMFLRLVSPFSPFLCPLYA